MPTCKICKNCQEYIKKCDCDFVERCKGYIHYIGDFTFHYCDKHSLKTAVPADEEIK